MKNIFFSLSLVFSILNAADATGASGFEGLDPVELAHETCGQIVREFGSEGLKQFKVDAAKGISFDKATARLLCGEFAPAFIVTEEDEAQDALKRLESPESVNVFLKKNLAEQQRRLKQLMTAAHSAKQYANALEEYASFYLEVAHPGAELFVAELKKKQQEEQELDTKKIQDALVSLKIQHALEFTKHSTL